jgi:enoyl-CoA hydratase
LLATSPTALKVTLAFLHRARELAPQELDLNQGHRLSCTAVDMADLVEGIRAQVIDKDRRPRWSPKILADVADADVERFFTSIGERELGLSPAVMG